MLAMPFTEQKKLLQSTLKCVKRRRETAGFVHHRFSFRNLIILSRNLYALLGKTSFNASYELIPNNKHWNEATRNSAPLLNGEETNSSGNSLQYESIKYDTDDLSNFEDEGDVHKLRTPFENPFVKNIQKDTPDPMGAENVHGGDQNWYESSDDSNDDSSPN